jgi:hypothetical protein
VEEDEAVIRYVMGKPTRPGEVAGEVMTKGGRSDDTVTNQLLEAATCATSPRVPPVRLVSNSTELGDGENG